MIRLLGVVVTSVLAVVFRGLVLGFLKFSIVDNY